MSRSQPARTVSSSTARRQRWPHDPEKACPGLDPGWVPVFGKGLPPRKRGSCSTNKLERDDESKKSHHALVSRFRVRISLRHPRLRTSESKDTSNSLI